MFTWVRGSGGRYAWDADGNLSAVLDGVMRHEYDSPICPRVQGDGRWLGVWSEPYSQNKCSAAAMTGGTAGSPGTLPTGVSEPSGSAGLTRTIALGSEGGVNYLELTYTGTATAASFDLDIGAAVSSYLNASNAATAVAAGQNWTFSAHMKRMGTATNLTSAFPYVKQNGGTTTGSHTIPLQTNAYYSWAASRRLTGTPTGVNGGVRFFITNGATVTFTVRIMLGQTEPTAQQTSPIPVVDGQRYAEYFYQPRNGANFMNRWGTALVGTMYLEACYPHWRNDAIGAAAWITDSSTGGRVTIGEGSGNDLRGYAVNWNGSASTTITTGTLYNDLPGTIARTAVSYSASEVIFARDNHAPITTAGQAFSATQPAGLYLGVNSALNAQRSMLFREIALWDTAFDEAKTRHLTRNFENDLYVDTFSRPDSEDKSLGKTEIGGLDWLSYGDNAAASEQGRSALVRKGELAVDFNDPAGGNVTIATYSRLSLPHKVNRMGAAVVWRDVAGRTIEIASIALIATADSREFIAAIAGSGGPGSVHNVWGINTADAGTFTGGSTETDEVTSFAKRTYGEVGWIGQVFWAGRTFLVLPDGRLIEPTESEDMWNLRGRYITWEHFRQGLGASDISNEVLMPMVSAA